MSVAVKGTSIYMTRGDTLKVDVAINKTNGKRTIPYVPEDGDEIRFALKHRSMNGYRSEYTDRKPLIYKVIPVDTMELVLNPEDTKDLGFGDYVYDMQITFADGSIDTFITEALFRLTPEVD